MHRRLWPARLESSSRRILTGIMLAGLALRLVSWKVLRGPVIRGDAGAYVEWAERLARGDFSGFSDYPLHQLYPMLIAPAYALGLPLSAYLFTLHLALSLGTVACLYLTGRNLNSVPVGLVCALVASAYPALLLWFPFVLSETPFFFFLSLFLAGLTRFLNGSPRSAASVAFLVLSGVLLLIARPVSVAVLAAAGLAMLHGEVVGRYGERRGRWATLALIGAGALAVGLLFSIVPIRRRILGYPTVAQSLWLSTRFSSSSIAEWAPIIAESSAISDRYAPDLSKAWEFKVREAVAFIGDHPGRYAMLVGRRFTSYWLPGFFSDGWSRRHRVFDSVLAVFLFSGAILSVARQASAPRWALLGAALALGVLTSFSQIDCDGRYRVPAEVICIPLAVDGYLRAARFGAENQTAVSADE